MKFSEIKKNSVLSLLFLGFLVFAGCNFEPSDSGKETPGQPRENKKAIITNFSHQAFQWVGRFFSVHPQETPPIFFDFDQVMSVSPQEPLGKLFFHQPSQKWSLYINPEAKMDQLKPLLIHEMTHVYQQQLQGSAFDRLKDDPQYVLGDSSLARNILQEGQAEYLAKKWNDEHQPAFQYPIKNIDDSLRDMWSTYSPQTAVLILTPFRYAFGYEFFNRLSSKITPEQFTAKSEALFKNPSYSTTNMLNDYLGLSIAEFMPPEQLRQIVREGLAPNSETMPSRGAMYLVFYLMSVGYSFAEGIESVKTIDAFSGTGSVEKNVDLLVLSSQKSTEIKNNFVRKLNIRQKSILRGADWCTLEYHGQELHLIQKQNHLLFLETEPGTLTHGKLASLLLKLFE